MTLFLLPLAAGLGSVAAQDVRIDRIQIVEAGIFQAETTATEKASGTATGMRHILKGTALIESTTRIEAKVGLHFGMQFRIFGRPNKAPVWLTSVTHYPAPGLKNPDTGTILRRGEYTLAATIGAVNYRGYVFERVWELVPGPWSFELWYAGRALAKQTFEVVAP
jgi:hypothetical protein